MGDRPYVTLIPDTGQLEHRSDASNGIRTPDHRVPVVETVTLP
jgi:hypothetical protein